MMSHLCAIGSSTMANALVADTSLSGLRVTRELTAIVARRRRPKTIVSDNGTELTGMAVLRWCQEKRIDWHYIASRCRAAHACMREKGESQRRTHSWKVSTATSETNS